MKGNRVTHDVDGSVLKLVQCLDPFDPERAYPALGNHLGIHRTAYSTTAIEGNVPVLKAPGVKFLSPITPCCSGDDSSSSIIAFYDPDKTVVELVEQPYVFHLLFKVITWLGGNVLVNSLNQLDGVPAPEQSVRVFLLIGHIKKRAKAPAG
jgi:hypothetical protein